MSDDRKVMKFLSDWSKTSGMAQKWKQEGVRQGVRQGVKQGVRQGVKQGRLEERQQIFTFLSQGHSLEEAKKKFAFA